MSFSGNEIIWPFVVIQFGVALWAWLTCARRLRQISKETARLRQQVAIPTNSRHDILLEGDSFFDGCEIFWECWNDYKKAIQGPTKNFPDPTPFFSYQRIITDYTNRHVAEMLPGVFTGLGILGTFIGLVVGLGGMSVQDASAIRGSIDILIGGMTTAFWTSICGLFLSLLWSVTDRKRLRQAEQALVVVHSILNELVPVQTEWDLLGQMAESQQEQLATFKSFASDTLIPEIITGIKVAFEETLNPHLHRTTQEFEEFSSVSSNHQIEGIDRIVAKILDGFNGAFSGQIEVLSDEVENMAKWQKTVSEDLYVLSNNLIEAARQEQEVILASSKLMEKIEDQVSVFEHFQGILAQMQAGVESDLEVLSTIADDLVGLSEVMEQNLKQYLRDNQELSDNRERQIRVLERQINEMQQFWTDAVEQMNQTRDGMVAGTQFFGRELDKGLQYTFKQYDKFLAEAVQRLRVVVSGMSEAVQDLPDEMGRIGANLSALNETVQMVYGEIDKTALIAAATEQLQGEED